MEKSKVGEVKVSKSNFQIIKKFIIEYSKPGVVIEELNTFDEILREFENRALSKGENLALYSFLIILSLLKLLKFI
jgi:hypothetical protein